MLIATPKRYTVYMQYIKVAFSQKYIEIIRNIWDPGNEMETIFLGMKHIRKKNASPKSPVGPLRNHAMLLDVVIHPTLAILHQPRPAPFWGGQNCLDLRILFGYGSIAARFRTRNTFLVFVSPGFRMNIHVYQFILMLTRATGFGSIPN